MTTTDLTAAKAKADALIAAAVYKATHQREFAPPWYDWQKEGFNTPFKIKSTMLLAGNQVGKSMSAGFHAACDLTGDYPDWWQGFRFDHGINALCAGVDAGQVKDVIQTQLFGEVEDDGNGKKFTGGWIHPDEILDVVWDRQTTNLAKRVKIKSRFGKSFVNLRGFTQSKTGSKTLSFAGSVYDLVWIDECPPDELRGQLKIRTINGNQGKGGRVRYTMTPELGMTDLVKSFMEDPGPSRKLIGPIPWDQAPHLTEELQASILADVPEHEHDMRKNGTPFFGSGLVYPIDEKTIKIDPFDVNTKPWMRAIKSVDLGLNHATVWAAYDPEDDTVYIVKTNLEVGAIPTAIHVATCKAMWKHIPTVFPHDVEMTERGSGQTVRKQYRTAGLVHTLDFKNPDGSIYVEPGIMEMLDRMRTNRFKVFSTCTEFWNEFRMYHREDGKIVKMNDHIMDASRYATIMAPRYAIPLQGNYRNEVQTVGAVGRL